MVAIDGRDIIKVLHWFKDLVFHPNFLALIDKRNSLAQNLNSSQGFYWYRLLDLQQYNGTRHEARRGFQWWSRGPPILSARSCARKILSLSSSAVGRLWSNQPFPSWPSMVCLKSKIDEKTPSFPMKKCNSSSVSLNTSLLWRHCTWRRFAHLTHARKVQSIGHSLETPVLGPGHFHDQTEANAIPGLLMLMMASIRKPAIPLSNHQLIIL